MLSFTDSIRKKISTLVLVSLVSVFSLPVFSQRAFTLRTPAFNIQGDAVIVGNRLVVGARTDRDNNGTTMTNIDADASAQTTINSSSATLTLPGSSTVVWAGLYWAGRSSDVANRNKIKFKKSGDTYATYTATQLDDGNTISGITAENHYQGFIDVTTYVQANGAGIYWGGDVLTITGDGSADPYSTGYYAGWALIVIYTDNTQPYRNITVFDGYSSVWSGNGTGTVTVPVSGFLTPSSGTFTTKLGVVAWEGDLLITNDRLRLNANVGTNNVSDAANPATNYFNGTITNSPRSPSTTQNWGVDFDYVTSNISLPLSSTSTNVYFNTSGDFYLPGALIFAVDINAVLLPVELLSFDATRKNNSALLEWATASESDNDYFQIERRTNTEDWQLTGRIAGQGRSTSYQFYAFEDETAVEYLNQGSPQDPIIYYRLKQVDFNGKFTYSDVKSVRFETNDAFDFSIYPNPARDNAKINFTAECDSCIEVKMTDSNGKIIFSTKNWNKNLNAFDLKHLNSGIYYIEARDDLCIIRKRFVVE
ncbi:MAG TPA: T9SS type A sorting domain-containing protein [Bacteroidia bacterium]|nr:T9SS type A sorting domain-containing protein [Bacteroidia bacterium]